MESLSSSHEIVMDQEYWQNLLLEVDTNKDGRISFEEFEATMTKIIFDQQVSRTKGVLERALWERLRPEDGSHSPKAPSPA